MYFPLYRKATFRRIVGILLVSLTMQLFAPFTPLFEHSSIAYAGDGSCGAVSASGPATAPAYGGVKLDKAATFLANMDDITGAYLDKSRNVIVFVGKTNTTLPEFDKDDLAVAIRALIFNNAIPAVSIDFKDLNNILAYPTMKVSYYGGIEDTNFGQVLVDADMQLKRYMIGNNENGTLIQTSVPGYQSVLTRWIANGPDLTRTTGSASRWWISPQTITLKRDEVNNAFVFDQVVMQVQSAPLIANNDPAWDKAAQDFATHHTQYYDAFAAEVPVYAKAKQLGKITGVIKWIKDNQIATDFEWVKSYQPTVIPTPREVPRITSATQSITVGNYRWDFWMTGGVEYSTPNSYVTDTQGAASQIKSASAAAASSSTDGVSWTFISSGQTYTSVAVSADVFRSVGSYAYSSTDVSAPSVVAAPFSLTRTYSSFATDKNVGFGPGWNFIPATLSDIAPGFTFSCSIPGGYSGSFPWKLAANTPNGRETFTYYSCTTGYVADDPTFHSKLTRSSDGTFVLTSKNRTALTFTGAPLSYNYRLTKIGDANNTAGITWTYNSVNAVTAITDTQSTQQIALTYNALGQIVSVQAPSGTTQYTYDSNGDLVQATDPRGNATTYTYSAGHLLKSITDPVGTKVVDNTYDPSGKVITQTDSNNITRAVAYDSTARTATWNDSNNRSGRDTYDSRARLVQSLNPIAATTTFTYGTYTDSPTTITDARGGIANITYSSAGNPLSYTDPNGGKIVYSWSAGNDLLQISDQRYTSLVGTPRLTTYTYDAKGNRMQSNVAGIATTTFIYTPQGKMAAQTDQLGNTTTFTYNANGQPLTVQDSLGKTTTYSYDPAGHITRVTDPVGVITSFTYDGNGNRLTATSPAGTVTYTYDVNNRHLKTTDPTGATATLTYDAVGNLVSVTDPLGAVTRYAYDQYKNVTKSTDALLRDTTFAYDRLNRETSYKTPLGKTWTKQYDAIGNVITGATPNATQTFVYDSLNRIVSTGAGTTTRAYTYDSAGRLTKVTGPSGASMYAYDVKDRLTQVTDPYGNVVSYQYDVLDNLTRITYPDGKTLQNQFDAAGHLTRQTDWNGGITTSTYTPTGALSTRTIPNGIVASYTYDSANRLATITYTTASQSVLFNQSYQRDGRGFVTRIDESGATGAHTTSYTYDSAGRVTSALESAGATSTFAYDTVGNITSSAAAGTDYIPKAATTTITIFKDAATTTVTTQTTATSTTVYATTTRALIPSIAPTVPYISRYQFNGVLGSTAKRADSLSPSQLLTESARISSGAGRFAETNGAYVFSNKRHLSLPLPYAPATGSTTLSAWVKMAPGAAGNIIGASNGSPAGYIRMYVLNGVLHADLGWTSGATSYSLVASSSAKRIDDNAWHKVEAAFLNLYPPANGDTYYNAIHLSVDGIPLIVKKGNSINYNFPTFSNKWTVGAMLEPNGRTDMHFIGSIDEIGVTNSAVISPSQIQARYNAEATTSPIYIWTPAATTSTAYATTTTVLLPSTTSNTITSIATSTATTTSSATTATSVVQTYATTTSQLPSVVTNSSTILATSTATTTIVTRTMITTATTTSTFAILITVPTTTIVAVPRSIFQSYTYNADDELTSMARSGTATSTTSSSYNASGDLISAAQGTTSRTYGWDVLGELSSVGQTATPTTSFTYDPSGNRIAKNTGSGTTRFVNDILAPNALVLAETNASNTPTRINVWGAAGLVSTGATAAASRYYPITDSQGSVRFLTDSTGAIVNSYTYTPYGAGATSNATATTTPYLYTGENLDSETGFTYLRARYYDPSTGRFISRDPVRGVQTNPLTQNPYIYAGDNPMMYSDPSGEFVPLLLLAWAVAEIGLSIWDGYDVVRTVSDPCASAEDKALAASLFSIGLVAPGGGYGKADDVAKFLGKKINQVVPRGWSLELIDQTIKSSYTTRKSLNKANGNPATAYYTKEGAYIVTDDVTGQFVQVGSNNNPAGWTPDSAIIDPYMPWKL